MSKEEDLAGTGYILKFYQDLELLSDWYAEFTNTKVLMENKVTKEELLKGNYEGLTDEEVVALKTAANTTRHYIIRTYIKTQALNEKITQFKTSDKLKPAYDKCKNTAIMDLSLIEDYIIELNRLFITGMLESLLVTARDLYAELTKNE